MTRKYQSIWDSLVDECFKKIQENNYSDFDDMIVQTDKYIRTIERKIDRQKLARLLQGKFKPE